MITKKESLLGEVKGDTPLRDMQDLLALDYLTISFDTPLEFMRNRKTLARLDDRLFEQDNILKDSYVNSMLKIISRLNPVYGDVRPFMKLSDWPVLQYTVKSFYSLDSSFYRIMPDNRRMLVITDHPDQFFYEGSQDKAGRDVRDNIMNNTLMDNVVDKNSRSDLVRALVKNGMGFLSTRKLEDFLYAREEDMLLENNIDTSRMSPTQRTEALRNLLKGLEASDKSRYYLLKTVFLEAKQFGKDITSMQALKNINAENHILFFEPTREQQPMNHLLADITKDAVLSYTSYPAQFKQVFSQAPELRQKSYLNRIITTVSQGRENLESNQWLMSNYPKLCKEVGISFKGVK
jgi:hypothetical protein